MTLTFLKISKADATEWPLKTGDFGTALEGDLNDFSYCPIEIKSKV